MDGQASVGYQKLRRKLHCISESEACRTCTVRIVERKASRLYLLYAYPAVRTCKTLGKLHSLAVYDAYLKQSFSQSERCLNGICQSRLYPFLYRKTVNNYLYRMLNVLIKLYLFTQIIKTAVNPYSCKTVLSCSLYNLGMFTFFSSYNRCHYHEFRAFGLLHDDIDHLINGLSFYLLSAVGTMRYSDTSKQESEVIIYLGNCPYSGSGISVSRFLIYGDSGRKPLYHLNLRLFHLSQKLPCI